MSKDYYKILEVDKKASPEEIKKAYRRLALKYHPDRGGGSESEKKFKEINDAYQTLSDAEKRAGYDQYGSAYENRANNQGFGGFEGFGNSNFSGFDFGGGMGNIFEDLFGQAFSSISAEVEITPAQAVLGDKLRISIEGEDLEINIPGGTTDGTTFRFQGKGRAFRGSKRGDLNLIVKVKIPRHITSEQKELWEKLKESESKKRSWWQK